MEVILLARIVKAFASATGSPKIQNFQIIYGKMPRSW
jgi:hypothetical protein